MPTARHAAFKLLNAFFDHVYIITIEKATDRRAKLQILLDGLDYQFFYGIDKAKLDEDPELLASVYNDEQSRKLHRYGKPMTIGHIACSLSHCMVYADIIKQGFNNALILEDDVVPLENELHHIAAILQELPANWDVLYWGYDRHENWNFASRLKQWLYHFMHAVGLLKWDHTMIRNLHAKPYSTYLYKAGYHDHTHAYSVTLSAAEKILSLQSPIVYNADPAVAKVIVNGTANGFITRPILFKQGFQVAPEEYISMIKH